MQQSDRVLFRQQNNIDRLKKKKYTCTDIADEDTQGLLTTKELLYRCKGPLAIASQEVINIPIQKLTSTNNVKYKCISTQANHPLSAY